jgi:type II secretory pathway pseudopilin PulG
MINMRSDKQNNGFALLITLIVVGVVLSVGLALLDLSIKQVRLSTNAKDSEVAFHAANAGLECARYWRRESSDEMEAGDPFTPTCFGESVTGDNGGEVNPSTNPDPDLDDATDGSANLYDYKFTWGTNSDRCTRIKTLVVSADVIGNGAAVDNMEELFPGYPDGNTFTCDAGGRCTVISVRGYNKDCLTLGGENTYGIVEREVLLQF